MYRKIAVDAPHIGFAQLDDLLEDRVRMARAGIFGIDQNRHSAIVVFPAWPLPEGVTRPGSPA